MISRKIKLTDGVIVLKPWMPWLHSKYSIKETQNWVRLQYKNWKNGSEYSFCILDAKTHKNLGGCGLNRVDPVFKSANLGYWVRSDATGHGVASRATRLLAKFGLRKLKLRRVEISMAVQNKVSRRVAEKAGAVYEGVLRNKMDHDGRVADAHMFSLIPGDLK